MKEDVLLKKFNLLLTEAVMVPGIWKITGEATPFFSWSSYYSQHLPHSCKQCQRLKRTFIVPALIPFHK